MKVEAQLTQQMTLQQNDANFLVVYVISNVSQNHQYI